MPSACGSGERQKQELRGDATDLLDTAQEIRSEILHKGMLVVQGFQPVKRQDLWNYRSKAAGRRTEQRDLEKGPD